jgi:3-oxoacyl-[acyl-carrier protein] reductase
MPDPRALAGHRALVTGGARGIGRAYALRLAALGAEVAVLDLDLRSFSADAGEYEQAGGQPVHEQIRALGGTAVGVTADVTVPEEVTVAVDEAAAQLGGLDILVCNAGGGSGSMQDSIASRADAEQVETIVQRNLMGTISTCRAAVPHLRAQGWGRIVTVSSLAGRRAYGDGGYAVYGAAKAGIAMYTRSLAQELGAEGITVNCIAPGYVATGRMAPMFESMGADVLRDSVALRRFGTPDDCAGVLEFLVTDLGAYVTGAVIPVDGGAAR